MTDQGHQVELEVIRADYTCFLAKTEVESCWAIETNLGDRVDVRFGYRAAGQIVLDAGSKNLEFILTGRDIAVNPVFSNKVVFVSIEADIGDACCILRGEGGRGDGALRVDYLVDDLDVVFLLEDKLVYL